MKKISSIAIANAMAYSIRNIATLISKPKANPIPPDYYRSA